MIENKSIKTKKLAILGILLSLAIIINIIEGLIPSFKIPGVKLGLANIITLIIIYQFGYQDALIVLILRIFLSGLLRGNIISYPFLMSLIGGIFAYFTMIILHKVNIFSEIGVSVAGAIMHSIGQILVVVVMTKLTESLYYLPYILIVSIATGIFVGVCANRINSYLNNHKKFIEF